MSFGERVLDWLFRHREKAVPPGDRDLVLVWEHTALADTPAQGSLLGEPWHIAHVTGELTLRAVLPDAGRLVAIVPPGFAAPADLAGRAWFGRPLEVQPRDLVAAAARRYCGPVADDALAAAVNDQWPALVERAPNWSADGPVTPREVRDVLLAVQLGTAARLDRLRMDELLSQWLVDGPPTSSTALLGAALADTHGREGRWLAWALGQADGVDLLVTAGALAATDLPSDLSARIPGLATPPDRAALGRLVEVACRTAWGRKRAAVSTRLASAEARAAHLPPEQAERFPLLRSPLVAAIRWHLAECAAGQAPADARIEALTGNLHAAELAGGIELARGAARLARFTQAVGGAVGPAWFTHARDDIAWGDLALREVRRRAAETTPDLAALANAVTTRYLEHRDGLNEAFARWLAASWPAVAASKDRHGALPLHQLTRCVVRPLLDAGHRVLLVVLDGCDLSTFVELVQRLPADAGIGIGLPALRDAQVREDLTPTAGFGVAVAPLPTVTSHARRALFAGEIPGTGGLDQTEAAAANATGDQLAFRNNPSLGTVRRTLLLKGDLDRPEAVRAAMQGDAALVAVVWNAVDDALASKETTPFSPWTFGGLGTDVLTTLHQALADDWVVIVTADHGHTPFVEGGRKVAPSALGNRYAAAELPGAVRFADGPLPARPLWLVVRVGAWAGTQRRGWHGGAGIEEVVVPFAFLKRCAPGEGRPSAPTWWWHRPEAVSRTHRVAAAPVTPLPSVRKVTATPLMAPPRASWADAVEDAEIRRVFLHIEQHGSVDDADLLNLLGSPRAVGRFSIRYEAWQAHLPFRVRVEMVSGRKRYVKE